MTRKAQAELVTSLRASAKIEKHVQAGDAEPMPAASRRSAGEEVTAIELIN